MLHFDKNMNKATRWLLSLTTVVLTALALFVLSVHSQENLLGGSDPLSPQVAFVPKTTAVSDSTITVTFDIEDGYYLYRDKTYFTVDSVTAVSDFASLITAPTDSDGSSSEQLVLLDAVYPSADILNDDFFGEMSIYRDKVSIEVPYTAATPLKAATLAVKYQGCADIGLCYPPTTQIIDVELAGVSNLASSSSELLDNQTPSSSLANLGKSSDTGSAFNSSPLESSALSSTTEDSDPFGLKSDQQELLPPELAYLPQIISADNKQVSIRWHIEPGYYLYRDKLSFSLQPAGSSAVSDTAVSPGTEQHDEFFGDVMVLRDSPEAQLTMAEGQDFSGLLNASLQINYQGCADIGVCFPPSVVNLPVVFASETSDIVATSVVSVIGKSANKPPSKAAIAGSNTPSAQSAQTDQSEQDRLFSMLGTNSVWLNVATFFGLGLLLAFTPCVLPMIPILSSLIVGKGDDMNTGKAFRLSLVYVLVMASTYAMVGVAVGLSGYNVQAFLQNPWVLSGIAVLFVVLSLSMFGFYELQMPTKVQEKLTQWSNNRGGGDVGGVAAMGFISTLIVGPCITAPLAGALIYIAKTGDALIGGAALFALGLGMGAPLLLIGTSAGKLLPRAGAWMNATKYVFGILMLIMAVYMISRFLPTTVIMALYGILAVMSGIFLGATDTLNRESRGWQRFGKGTGIVVSIYGLALLVGALSGGSSYTTPLRGAISASSGQAGPAEEHELVFAPVKSVEGLQQIVAQASSEGRPVMLDFYADWCISCKEMEAFTFTDKRVQALLKDAIKIQADVTANDDIDQELLKHFDLFGPPGIIFYDESGTELRPARVVGFMSANKFTDHIQRFLGGSQTLATLNQ